VSRKTWLTVRVIAPIMAIAAVVVAIVVTDSVMGGADEPEPENLAPLGPGAAAATPIPPTAAAGMPAPTVAPTQTPTPITGPVAEMRDARRMEDLGLLKAALAEYYEEEDEYPSTGGNIQTVCNYPEIDALCEIEDLIDPIPTDPSGDPGKNGYWYTSDGKTFTLIAGMELEANATPGRCPELAARHTDKDNLYCLRDTD